MSVKAITWAFDQDLKPADMLTLVALADWADEDGYCFPGIDRLLERVHVSRRTMIGILARLEEGGFFTRERRSTAAGKRTSNGYWLALDRPSADSAHGESYVQITTDNVQTVAHTKDIRNEPSVEPSVKREGPSLPTVRPLDWAPKTKHFEIAAERKVNLELELAKFTNWADAKGVRYINWDAAFANWLLRASPTGGFAPNRIPTRDRDQEIRDLLSGSLGLDNQQGELT